MQIGIRSRWLIVIGTLLLCFIFGFTSVVLAQSDQWQELSPTDAPGGRSFHSITDVNGRILLFGGLNGVLNDTWEWERLNRNWKKITPQNDPPPARYSHGAAAKGDKLYIFFGQNVNGVVLSDVWSYDPSTSRWQIEHQVGTEMPAPRYMHSCVTLPDGSIALFGGQNADGPGDRFLWKYETETGIWNKKASMPGVPRYGHSAALNGGNLYVFGGETPDGLRNDMWKYSPANDNWASVDISGELPPARRGAASAYWGNNCWIFGGEGQNGETLGDVWRFDFTTYTWTKISDIPEAVHDAAAVAFAGESIDILLFGGMDSNGQRTGRTFLYEEKDDECFIATASYDTPSNRNIVALRAFRDNILAKFSAGRAFIDVYYSTSPPIASVLAENNGLRLAVRWLLIAPAAYLAKIFSYPAALAILGIIMVGLGIWATRNKTALIVLQPLGVGVLTVTVLTATVFLIGSAAYASPWCGLVAAYILPLILPLSVVAAVTNLTLGKLARARG